MKLFILYLEYFREFESFLPKTIPEDIVYDEAKLKVLLGEEGFPDVSKEGDSKKKLKKISDIMGQGMEEIEPYLIYWFVKQKNADYKNILDRLKK